MSQNSTKSTSSAFVPISVDDGEKDGKPRATTRLDKQVASVSNLQSNSDVLKDVVSLVEEVLDILKPASFKRKQYVISSLNGIKQAVSTVHKSVASDAIVLSPIPSMSYVHSRKKRTVSPETTFESIKAFNKQQPQQQQQLKRKRTTSPTPSRNLNVKANTVLEYPLPCNGKEYTPTEAYTLLSDDKYSKYRRKLILEWISLKYVPGVERTIYLLMANTKAGAPIPDRWDAKG